MGERSLNDCIEEQLIVLREAARMNPACGFTLQAWYDDGANLKHLACYDDSEDHGVVYAWGYLNGCADHCDVTVQEYLWDLGLSFDYDADDKTIGGAAVIAATPKKPRRKARHK